MSLETVRVTAREKEGRIITRQAKRMEE